MSQRVLIVDDELLLAKDVANTLAASGYEVHIVQDGPSALVESQQFKPDIILLDLVLPTMSGLAVCAELRRLPATRRVPIVMLTARDDEDNITRAFAAGADDYITKPVKKYELIPRLGAHLRSKRLLDELEQQTRDRTLLLELQNTLASRFDLRQILRVVASRLIEAIHVERCSIILIEPGADAGVVVVASEDPNVQDIKLELKNYPEITAVGGLTIGADPIASAIAALSHETGQNLKAFLVRKEAKGHGTGSRIEGDLERGEKVAIVEDTVTTGGSARKAIEAVVEVGAVPVVVVAIADREDPDAASFRQEYRVEPLLTLSEIRGH